MKKRIIEVVPIISLMLFFIFGLYFENWNLGATFFLLIPVSWILLTGNPWKKLSEIIPLISLMIFLWIGLSTGIWHPTWLVFLLIPLVNIIVEKRITSRKLVGIVVVGLYIAIGFLTPEGWEKGWVVFLLIPIVNTLFFPQKNAYVNFSKDQFKTKFKNIIIEEEKDDF
jgi:hypothetical protein